MCVLLGEASCSPQLSKFMAVPAAVEAPPLPNRDAENANAQRFVLKRGKAASSRRTPYKGAEGRNAASVKPRKDPTHLSSSSGPQTLHHQSLAHSLKIWISRNPFGICAFRTLCEKQGGRGGTSFKPKRVGSFRPGSPSFRRAFCVPDASAGLSAGTFPNTLLDLRLRPRHYRYCQNVATACPPHPSYGCQVRWVADGGDT